MFLKIYQALLDRYGKQGWWPVKGKYHPGKLSEQDKLEICIGAILAQNTSWKNVEKAIKELHAHKLIDLKKLAEIDEKKLALFIKSSGYYRQKAKKLKIFARHVLKDGSLSDFFKRKKLREELLSLWGIGPETADSIMLYAANKPVFVIDAYTKRIMSRLGACKNDVDYHELQLLFHKKLPLNQELFNEYHALLVELAKKHCVKNNPVCSSCPLKKSCKKKSFK